MTLPNNRPYKTNSSSLSPEAENSRGGCGVCAKENRTILLEIIRHFLCKTKQAKVEDSYDLKKNVSVDNSLGLFKKYLVVLRLL